jgi:F-type H+-transporting ATPase subunit delta
LNAGLTRFPPLAPVAQASPVAVSYAVALAESAQASNTLDQIHADVETFAAYSLSNAGIASVLANPVLSDEKKKDLVAKIAKEGSFSPVFVSFLNLLINKRRINLINQVLAEFEAIYCDLSDTQARVPGTMNRCAGAGAAGSVGKAAPHSE